jgi:DNA-binding response OmpR family regulator
MPARTVVVVEDEELIAASLAARLRAEGFEVGIASDGPSGVELCRRLRPDLVVLDVMLPAFDGYEVCRRVQADRPVPVLMLTARDSETDVLLGLGIGADDYVTKPFSPRQVVARVQAILRRADRATMIGSAPGESESLSVGALEIDLASRRVSVSGEEVRLTRTEFALVEHLARRPGVVFTRERLLTEVWGYADGAGGRTVDSHVAALRRKLGSQLIRTEHGVGYALREVAA